jgi:hypothetical protein
LSSFLAIRPIPILYPFLNSLLVSDPKQAPPRKHYLPRREMINLFI